MRSLDDRFRRKPGGEFGTRWVVRGGERIQRLLSLPLGDYHRLVLSFCVLLAVRVALWVLPFKTVSQLLNQCVQASFKTAVRRGEDLARFLWAIRVARRFVPYTTCLTHALGAYTLLGRAGHAATLRIGVARKGHGNLQAHAWVECEGRSVVGGAEAGGYASILTVTPHG